MIIFRLLFFLIFMASIGLAAENQEDPRELPLFEYGLGVGFIRYWHYPASNQTKDVYLPVPTFQYRGEILRADDREGARAYLIRQNFWSLEMGGGVLPNNNSSENFAREGMEPIPWGFQLGPQLVTHFDSPWQVKLGVYQAFNTDFKFTKTNGGLAEARLVYNFDLLEYKSKLNISGTLLGASREFMSTYFDVSPSEARENRPVYASVGGFLSYDLTIFFKKNFGRSGFYSAARQSWYDLSANKRSPLHKSDSNLTFFVGMTYTIGESERRAIRDSEAKGAIQKMQKKYEEFRDRRLRDEPNRQ